MSEETWWERAFHNWYRLAVRFPILAGWPFKVFVHLHALYHGKHDTLMDDVRKAQEQVRERHGRSASGKLR